jgi:hypothetical protein
MAVRSRAAQRTSANVIVTKKGGFGRPLSFATSLSSLVQTRKQDVDAGIKPAMTLLEMRPISHIVMAGLVPAIHVLLALAA